ncbi:MAG: F0F1 ATP synthase subunit delta, partial [Oscillospiraceae bacterium]|nr:F0F1 ATP synthase subunit delta [Oscillospiraceae bacterium]
MTQTVGKVYAEALFLLAKEEHKEEQVWKDLNEVADVMADNPQFITLLGVPTLSAPERVAILRRVIGDGEGITENFLCLL